MPVGRYPNGRTKYTEVRAPTQAEVVERRKNVEPPGPDTTVAQWAAKWLEGLSVRASTFEGYERTALKRIVPDLGHRRLAAVAVSDVKALVKKWMSGKRPLAATTVGLALAHGQAMFEAAVEDDLIAKNPFARCPRPETAPREIDPFPPADLLRIVAAFDTYSSGPLVALLAATGCRLGEASALDVTDWDPAAGTIAITKTWSKRFGSGPPKSKHSYRTIEIPAEVRSALVAAAGARKTGPLFRTGANRRVIKSMVQRAFARLLARLGLRRRNVHQLRHSVATMMISAGVPIGDVAEYLGDSEETIVRTYLHPTGVSPAGAISRALRGVA